MRTRRRILDWIFILSMFLAVPLQAQLERSFFFVQLADPQFGMYPLQKDYSKERRNLSIAIAAINKVKPDFVIICGDLVNRAGDERQIAAFKQTMSKLDPAIPLYLVAGNHDVGNRPTPLSLADYRSTFGSDYYTFTHNGQRFIVLNSSLIKDPSKAQEAAKEQRQWLSIVLDSVKKERSQPIVFQHHPYFIRNASEPSGYFNIPRKTRMEYLNLLDGNGITYVFAGHLHDNAHGSYKSLNMVTTGPVGMPLGLSPSGIRIVIVRPSGVQHEYYSLKDIPHTIDVDNTGDLSNSRSTHQ